MKPRKQVLEFSADNDPFMAGGKLQSAQATAEQLGVTPRTLHSWRVNGGGPDFCRIGRRRVMYRQGAIDQYIWGRTYRHTAEEATRHA